MSGKFLLGNMLSAICNKNCFYNNPVKVIYSDLCKNVLDKMIEGGYIEKYDIIDVDNKKSINIYLTISNGKKIINSFKLISKPSCRIYNSLDEIKEKVSYNPYALLLISTSKGVLNAYESIEQKVGGEVLCEIF